MFRKLIYLRNLMEDARILRIRRLIGRQISWLQNRVNDKANWSDLGKHTDDRLYIIPLNLLGLRVHMCRCLQTYTVQMYQYAAGASIPSEAVMHFPPVSDFPPYFRKKFRTSWKILTFLPFPKFFLDFHPPKYLTTIFSHWPQIRNFPLFSLFEQFIPPSFGQFFLAPYFC